MDGVVEEDCKIVERKDCWIFQGTLRKWIVFNKVPYLRSPV